MKKKETVVEKNKGLSSFFADLVSRDEEICVVTTSKKGEEEREEDNYKLEIGWAPPQPNQ